MLNVALYVSNNRYVKISDSCFLTKGFQAIELSYPLDFRLVCNACIYFTHYLLNDASNSDSCSA